MTGLVGMALVWLLVRYSHRTPEVYLIPQGYIGLVTVAFDLSTEVPCCKEDGKLIFRIPHDGVLLTQCELENGTGPVDEFYYENSMGSRHRIPVQFDQHLGDSVLQVMAIEYGVVNNSTSKPYFYNQSYKSFIIDRPINLKYYSGDSVAPQIRRKMSRDNY